MEEYLISINGDKSIFRLIKVGGTQVEIEWPANDTFYDGGSLAQVRFVKKSSKEVLGKFTGYLISQLALTQGNPFADFNAFQTWAQDNLGFNTASGGSGASVTAETFTGTVIPLDGYYTQDNTGIDTATWTLGVTVVNGGAFDILINQATEPTITGATKIPATAAFQANKLSVIKGTVIQGVVYYYFLALAT